MSHTNHYFTQYLRSSTLEIRATEGQESDIRLSISIQDIPAYGRVHQTDAIVDMNQQEQNELIIAILKRRGVAVKFDDSGETIVFSQRICSPISPFYCNG